VRHILDEKEKELLLNDKNSWIGMPIGLKDEENSSVRSSSSQSYAAFRLQSSPYHSPVVKHDHTINKPKRPTGLKLLDSLGWKNPLTEQRKEKVKEDTLATSGIFPERKISSSGTEGPRLPPSSSNGKVQGTRPSSPQKTVTSRGITTPQGKVNPRSMAESRVEEASHAVEKEQRKQMKALNSASFQSLNSPGKFVDSSFAMTNSANFPLGNTTSSGSPSRWQETGKRSLIRGNLLEDESQTFDPSDDHHHGLNSSGYHGTTKPMMGHPITIGKTTQLLTDKGVSIQQLAREKEKELFALTHPSPTRQKPNSGERFSSSSLQFTGKAPPQSPLQSSKWNTMKTSLLQKTPHSSDKKRERAERLEKRNRPWPIPKTEYYQMEYSWLAQPMVAEAAKQVYQEEKEKERLREEEEMKRKQEIEEKEKKLQSTLLQKVKKYNSQEVSKISTLKDLKEFEKETALKIREERLNAKPIQHPYGWSMPNANSSVMS
jgi:hypothetical protein